MSNTYTIVYDTIYIIYFDLLYNVIYIYVVSSSFFELDIIYCIFFKYFIDYICCLHCISY